MTSIHTEARIKSGMPIKIEASVLNHEPHVGAEIEYIDLFWPNTGERVSRKFDDSLTKEDWELVDAAIWEAYEAR